MMRLHSPVVSLLGATLALLSLPTLAASRFNPANPAPFERVDLRLTVDSCSFDPDSVSVASKGDTIRVYSQPRYCLVAGTPVVVDVQLGSLPAGTYQVELYDTPDGSTDAVETLKLTVRTPIEIMVFPRPPHPLTSYSGWWMSASEPGWGLTLMQGGTYGLFGAWHVFDEHGAPHWYTLQAGAWSSTTLWSGKIVASTGSWLGLPTYDPAAFHNTVVGDATLDFRQTPGHEGEATLRYTLDGVTASKTIQRPRL